MKITDAQYEKLKWLHERGGSGYLDRYGRIVAAGQLGQQGWQQALLNLVANGFISGGDERLFVTEKGRSLLVPNANITGG